MEDQTEAALEMALLAALKVNRATFVSLVDLLEQSGVFRPGLRALALASAGKQIADFAATSTTGFIVQPLNICASELLDLAEADLKK